MQRAKMIVRMKTARRIARSATTAPLEEEEEEEGVEDWELFGV